MLTDTHWLTHCCLTGHLVHAPGPLCASPTSGSSGRAAPRTPFGGPSERQTSLHLTGSPVHGRPGRWHGPSFPAERAAREHSSNREAVQGHGWWPRGPWPPGSSLAPAFSSNLTFGKLRLDLTEPQAAQLWEGRDQLPSATEPSTALLPGPQSGRAGTAQAGAPRTLGGLLQLSPGTLPTAGAGGGKVISASSSPFPRRLVRDRMWGSSLQPQAWHPLFFLN